MAKKKYCVNVVDNNSPDKVRECEVMEGKNKDLCESSDVDHNRDSSPPFTLVCRKKKKKTDRKDGNSNKLTNGIKSKTDQKRKHDKIKNNKNDKIKNTKNDKNGKNDKNDKSSKNKIVNGKKGKCDSREKPGQQNLNKNSKFESMHKKETHLTNKENLKNAINTNHIVTKKESFNYKEKQVSDKQGDKGNFNKKNQNKEGQKELKENSKPETIHKKQENRINEKNTNVIDVKKEHLDCKGKQNNEKLDFRGCFIKKDEENQNQEKSDKHFKPEPIYKEGGNRTNKENPKNEKNTNVRDVQKENLHYKGRQNNEKLDFRGCFIKKDEENQNQEKSDKHFKPEAIHKKQENRINEKNTNVNDAKKEHLDCKGKQNNEKLDFRGCFIKKDEEKQTQEKSDKHFKPEPIYKEGGNRTNKENPKNEKNTNVRDVQKENLHYKGRQNNEKLDFRGCFIKKDEEKQTQEKSDKHFKPEPIYKEGGNRTNKENPKNEKNTNVRDVQKENLHYKGRQNNEKLDFRGCFIKKDEEKQTQEKSDKHFKPEPIYKEGGNRTNKENPKNEKNTNVRDVQKENLHYKERQDNEKQDFKRSFNKKGIHKEKGNHTNEGNPKNEKNANVTDVKKENLHYKGRQPSENQDFRALISFNTKDEEKLTQEKFAKHFKPEIIHKEEGNRTNKENLYYKEKQEIEKQDKRDNSNKKNSKVIFNQKEEKWEYSDEQSDYEYDRFSSDSSDGIVVKLKSENQEIDSSSTTSSTDPYSPPKQAITTYHPPMNCPVYRQLPDEIKRERIPVCNTSTAFYYNPCYDKPIYNGLMFPQRQIRSSNLQIQVKETESKPIPNFYQENTWGIYDKRAISEGKKFIKDDSVKPSTVIIPTTKYIQLRERTDIEPYCVVTFGDVLINVYSEYELPFVHFYYLKYKMTLPPKQNSNLQERDDKYEEEMVNLGKSFAKQASNAKRTRW